MSLGVHPSGIASGMKMKFEIILPILCSCSVASVMNERGGDQPCSFQVASPNGSQEVYHSPAVGCGRPREARPTHRKASEFDLYTISNLLAPEETFIALLCLSRSPMAVALSRSKHTGEA